MINYEQFIIWYADHADTIHRVICWVIIGFPVLRILLYILRNALKERVSDQHLMLTTKIISYGGTLIILVSILREMGFNLTALLGAAGIAGVAIGFAAQTSLSNVISGIFLLWEKPFQIGDLIDADGKKGIVHSMDLLSINLRTFDNQLIRIPNETLVKSTFTNVTRFPIRRMDISIGVAYKEDIDRVMKVLREIADSNPYCLDEPEPVIMFKQFGDSSLDLLFGLWFAKEDFVNLRNTIHDQLKKRFDEEDIEIPFPHRTLYTGSVTEPFPIMVVNPADAEQLKAE